MRIFPYSSGSVWCQSGVSFQNNNGQGQSDSFIKMITSNNQARNVCMYKGKFVCLSGCWFLLDPVSAVYVMIDSWYALVHIPHHSSSRTVLVLFHLDEVLYSSSVIINLHDNVEAVKQLFDSTLYCSYFSTILMSGRWLTQIMYSFFFCHNVFHLWQQMLIAWFCQQFISLAISKEQ